MKFPFQQQLNEMDCGPTCIYIISKHHGRNFSIEKLRELTEIGKDGVNLLGISDAAETIGFRTQALQASVAELANDIQLSAILHWGQNHFVVLYKVKRNQFYIADPAKALLRYTASEFTAHWLSGNIEENTLQQTGIVRTLEPTPNFYSNQYSSVPAGFSLYKLMI